MRTFNQRQFGRAPPVLPEIRDKYREYKLNTKQVVRWIVCTAAEAFDLKQAKLQAAAEAENDAQGLTEAPPRSAEHDQSAIETQSGKDKRPKAKRARARAAKEAAAAAATTPANDRVVSLNRLVQLCKQISECDSINTPVWVLAKLGAVIQQRKAVAAFYSTDTDVMQKNKSHIKAIQLLEEAFSYLGGKVWLQNLQLKNEAVKAQVLAITGVGYSEGAVVYHEFQEDGTVGLAIMLSVYLDYVGRTQADSPSDDDNDGTLSSYGLEYEDADGKGTRSSSDRRGRSNGPQAPKFGEMEVAILHFLRDMTLIRKYLNEIWSTVHPRGSTTNLVASFVTNQAVQLVKQLEKKLEQDFPNLRGYEAMLDVYMVFLPDVSPHEVHDEELYKKFDQLLLNTYQVLNSFREIIQAGHAPVAKPGYWGIFDPKADRSRMTPEQKRQEDRSVILNYLPDLFVLHMLAKKYDHGQIFIGDFGLARDFGMLVDRPRSIIPTSLVFECQIMLEILYAQRLNVDTHIQRMRHFQQYLKAQVQRIQELELEVDTNMKGFKERCVEEAISIETCMGKDPIHEYKTKKWLGQVPDIRRFDKDTLWKSNPWLTSNAIADATIIYFRIGVELCSGAGFIPAILQLWNMLEQLGHFTHFEQTGSLESRIQDVTLSNQPNIATSLKALRLIKHLFAILGPSIFGSEPPKERFYNRFLLNIGIKAEAFAARASKRKVKECNFSSEKGAPHHPGGRGPTPEVLSEAWCLGRDDYYPKESQTGPKNAPANTNNQPPTVISLLERTRSILNREQGLLLSNVNNATGSPESMKTEAPAGPILTLDFVDTHLICLELFRKLHNDPIIKAVLLKAFGPDYIERESQLSFLVGYFMILQEHGGGDGVGKMLGRIAEIMWEDIGTRGVEEVLIRPLVLGV